MSPSPVNRPRHHPYLAAGLLAALAIGACGGEAEAPVPGTLLAGGLLVDGTGGPPRQADVRIQGDRIVAVGELVAAAGDTVIQLEGAVLAPGFIDTHSHADWGLGEHPEATALVSQGVTTAVVGNDGGSQRPLAEFFAALEAAPPAVNLASYSGHGSLRAEVMGEDFRREATDEEIAAMAALLREDLEAGALGLSSGLEYDPGIYSATGEVIALAREAAAVGGRYISHIRSEDRWFWDAVDEIVRIGAETGMPVQISHAKLAMKNLWGRADEFIARLEEARANGVDITADIYPYPYWQSTLTVLFPERDFHDLAEARRVLEEIVPPEGVLVTEFAPQPEYAGLTLDRIAALRGEEPAVALLALIAEAEAMRAARDATDDQELSVESMIGTSMDEADIEAIMRWEHTNFCTDGELAGTHPRGYGSFPRILGRTVRERGVMSLEAAVHKSTGLAADHMGIVDRGRVVVGARADLVVFDPDTILDRATTDDPHAVSTGVIGTWVNGVRVWADGAATGARPGQVVRRAAGGGER